ncbi:hypothetical protein DLX66_22830 [Shigella flexneri]|nr:hypothetical protein [Shigella flexneri]
MEHLCCSEVSISPLFRWPNSVCHFNECNGSRNSRPITLTSTRSPARYSGRSVKIYKRVL